MAETPMTPDEFAERMAAVPGDPEEGHMEADNLMCELLRQLGYEKGVKIYESLGKWYA